MIARPIRGGEGDDVFDRSRLRLLPLRERQHKLDLSIVRKLVEVEVVSDSLAEVGRAVARARASGSAVVLMLGGHVIRAGVQAYLIDLMERVNFSKGDVIFEEGEQGDWFFIVRKGKVDVIKKKKWFKDKLVKELGPEDFFGEFALYLNKTRSATLRAAEDSVCFVLFKNKFREQTEKHPEFKREIEKLIEERNVDIA